MKKKTKRLEWLILLFTILSLSPPIWMCSALFLLGLVTIQNILKNTRLLLCYDASLAVQVENWFILAWKNIKLEYKYIWMLLKTIFLNNTTLFSNQIFIQNLLSFESCFQNKCFERQKTEKSWDVFSSFSYVFIFNLPQFHTLYFVPYIMFIWRHFLWKIRK